METSSRDRISVDLHGLKAMLVEQSAALDLSPSALVRRALVKELGISAPEGSCHAPTSPPRPTAKRTRICLRMGVDDATATLQAARRAGMSPGDFVAGLVAGVPVALNGAGRADLVLSLTASNAELSTLNRNVYHLADLLRQAQVGPALFYREMLDTLSGDVRRHLALASGALADLRPRALPPLHRQT